MHEAAVEWRDKEEASEQIEASELTLDILTMLELGLEWAILGKIGAGGNGNIVPDLALVETEVDVKLVETRGLVDIEEGSEEFASAELILVSLNDALAWDLRKGIFLGPKQGFVQ